MKLKIVTLLIVLITQTAYALEFKPYPNATITKKEWIAYNNLVNTNFNKTKKVYPTKKLTTYSDTSNRVSYSFTMPGHDAHPAWITRKVVQNNQGIHMDQIGYFAGKEPAFAKLFNQYQVLNKQIEQKFKQ